VTDKIYYGFANYHIFTKNNDHFPRFNMLNNVLKLLQKDKKNGIEIPPELFGKFQRYYSEFRDLEPHREFPDGVICNQGIITWTSWGIWKKELLEILEDFAAEVEVQILSKIDIVKLKELEKKLAPIYGSRLVGGPSDTEWDEEDFKNYRVEE